jgi:glycosyltransferase involved in cell wall biosynthesis
MNVPAAASPDLLGDVTIVVPVWDSYVERFLPEALDALERSAASAQIVIVDNASTVSVPGHNGALVVRSSERLSVGAARNLGLSAVDTPYVVFWDADDVILPGALSELRRRLEACPTAMAAASVILESSTHAHHWPRPATLPLAHFPRIFGFLHCVCSLFPTTGSVMLRTSSTRDAGGFADTDGGDDWVLGASLAFRGEILFDSRPGRLYRQHPDSISAAWRPVPHLIAHAAAVRRRVRADDAIPRPARVLAPFLAPLQWLVIFVLRPLRRARRRA